MSIEYLAIHVVSLAVEIVDIVMIILAALPVTNVTRRLVQIAHQCSDVLLVMMIVNGSVVAAVQKTYSLGQTNHVLTVATFTVTIICHLATLAMTMADAAINVESSELWKVVVVRERDVWHVWQMLSVACSPPQGACRGADQRY